MHNDHQLSVLIVSGLEPFAVFDKAYSRYGFYSFVCKLVARVVAFPVFDIRDPVFIIFSVAWPFTLRSD